VYFAGFIHSVNSKNNSKMLYNQNIIRSRDPAQDIIRASGARPGFLQDGDRTNTENGGCMS
jgi:hypothetical protein